MPDRPDRREGREGTTGGQGSAHAEKRRPAVKGGGKSGPPIQQKPPVPSLLVIVLLERDRHQRRRALPRGTFAPVAEGARWDDRFDPVERRRIRAVRLVRAADPGESGDEIMDGEQAEKPARVVDDGD